MWVVVIILIIVIVVTIVVVIMVIVICIIILIIIRIINVMIADGGRWMDGRLVRPPARVDGRFARLKAQAHAILPRVSFGPHGVVMFVPTCARDVAAENEELRRQLELSESHVETYRSIAMPWHCKRIRSLEENVAAQEIALAASKNLLCLQEQV